MKTINNCKRLIFVYLFTLFYLGCGGSNIPEFLQGKILFLGDSITHNGTYVSLIEYELVQQFPNQQFDVIAIGLSSETVSGLTEPGHPYPRPCVLDRLDSALTILKPDIVAVCYGMNDGIYHPQSEERFGAYKNGMTKLIDKVKAAGARIILLTPPPFDPDPIQEKLADDNAQTYGYNSPYSRYNLVLQDYASWLKTVQQPDILTVDFNTDMSEYLNAQRQTQPNYTFSKDGVHPDTAGHLIMARSFLHAVGITTDTTDVQVAIAGIQSSELFKLVNDRRALRSNAWRKRIGHTHKKEWPGLPVEEAEEKAAQLYMEIKNMSVQKE